MTYSNHDQFYLDLSDPFLSALFKTSNGIAITISNSRGELVFYNHGAERIFTIKKADVLGKLKFSALVDRNFDLDESEREKLKEKLKKGEIFSGYLTYTDTQGVSVTLQTSVCSLKLAGWQKAGTLSVSINRSTRLRLESEILELKKSIDDIVNDGVAEAEMLRYTYEDQASTLASAFDDLLYTKQALEKKSKILKLANKKLIESREKQRILSITDPLTSLYNRRYFNEVLEKELLRSQRYKKNFALIIADIDYFKAVNDNYGHPFGDEVILGVTRALNESVRDCDTIARWGGEEFVLLLPESDTISALAAAERVRKHVADQIFQPKNVQVTISIGVVVCSLSNDKITTDALLLNADNALYQAKETGRNKVTLFKPSN